MTPPGARCPSILYIESTLPDGQTIAAYRRSRPPRLRGWRRLVHAGRASNGAPRT